MLSSEVKLIADDTYCADTRSLLKSPLKSPLESPLKSLRIFLSPRPIDWSPSSPDQDLLRLELPLHVPSVTGELMRDDSSPNPMLSSGTKASSPSSPIDDSRRWLCFVDTPIAGGIVASLLFSPPLGDFAGELPWYPVSPSRESSNEFGDVPRYCPSTMDLSPILVSPICTPDVGVFHIYVSSISVSTVTILPTSVPIIGVYPTDSDRKWTPVVFSVCGGMDLRETRGVSRRFSTFSGAISMGYSRVMGDRRSW